MGVTSSKDSVNGRRAKSLRYLGRSDTMLIKLRGLMANDSGATAVEYTLIGALITLAILAILSNIGTRLSQEFSEISSAFK
jgi:Flp pilus assembly pilin Flp